MARILATVAARICDSDSYGVVSARTSGDEEWPKVCVTVGTARRAGAGESPNEETSVKYEEGRHSGK